MHLPLFYTTRASMRTYRDQQPVLDPRASPPFSHRAVNALRQFPCYFPHIAIIYNDSVLRSCLLGSGCRYLWPDKNLDPRSVYWRGRKIVVVTFRKSYRRSSTYSSGQRHVITFFKTLILCFRRGIFVPG